MIYPVNSLKFNNIFNNQTKISFSGSYDGKDNIEHSSLDIVSSYNLAKLNPLNKYKLSDKQKEYILSFKDDFYSYIEDTDETWDMFHNYPTDIMGCWIEHCDKDENKCAWKMHIFADNMQDYMLLATVLVKYFTDNHITSKMIEPYYFDELNSDEQKGKAISIYPKSIDEFKKIAKDIDYIIKIKQLNSGFSHIEGDKQLGSTGRIFYRYEYRSGQYKDTILNLADGRDYSKYRRYYDINRGNSSYLAPDMTQEDDPFLNLLK